MVPAFSKILLEHFQAKWTRFAWEARQLSSIGAVAAGQDSPAVTAARLCEFA
jgi:hypothetical protein